MNLGDLFNVNPNLAGEPLPFVLLRSFHDIFSAPALLGGVSLYDVSYGLGWLFFCVASYWALMKVQGSSRSSVTPVILRIGIALVMVASAPEARDGLYNMYFNAYSSTQGFYGAGLKTAMDTIKGEVGEEIATAMAAGSMATWLAANTQASGGGAMAWLSRLNPFKNFSRSTMKYLASAGSGVGKFAIKNLGRFIVGFVSLFYIPYFIAAFLILMSILFYPIAFGLFPTFGNGTAWVSRWVSTTALTILMVMFTPIIFAVATQTTIVTPLVGTLNALEEAVQDIMAGGAFLDDDPEMEGGQELASDSLALVTAASTVIFLPLTLISTFLVLGTIGLIVGLYLIFNFERMLGGYVAASIGSGLGWAVAAVSVGSSQVGREITEVQRQRAGRESSAQQGKGTQKSLNVAGTPESSPK